MHSFSSLETEKTQTIVAVEQPHIVIRDLNVHIEGKHILKKMSKGNLKMSAFGMK